MKTILIDDDPISNMLTEHMIKMEGFSDNVTVFMSAEDALLHLKENFDTACPDIIFLDLNMPLMNGWQFLDALAPLKDHLKNKCLIYILTSSLDTSDISKAGEYELVSGFIHKPISSDDLKIIQQQTGGEATD